MTGCGVLVIGPTRLASTLAALYTGVEFMLPDAVVDVAFERGVGITEDTGDMTTPIKISTNLKTGKGRKYPLLLLLRTLMHQCTVRCLPGGLINTNFMVRIDSMNR